MSAGMTFIPADYETINVCSSAVSPSTIHASNTALALFFRRYYLQQAFSVFKFDGMPDSWDQGFFKYILFGMGYISIINTDRFGVIPMNCSLYGIGVFYQPTHCIIANRLLSGIIQPRIGVECGLIKLQPNYSSIMDIICYFADLAALTCESFGVNLINTKLAYVFFSENKAESESFKSLYDKISAGNPAAVIDKKLIRDDGTPNWMLFNQNVKQTFIGLELLEALSVIDDKFRTFIGIPNANTEKKERMIVDEVNANNFATDALCIQWLEEMERGIKQSNDLFGINLKVSIRERKENAHAVDQGPVSMG